MIDPNKIAEYQDDADKLARYKIVNDIDSSYFVEASAGSGKTYSLTRRMVSLIESGIDISKICTITFTKAAANEFFERFQSLLSERCNPSDETKKIGESDLPYTSVESRKRCMQALANIDLCFMGTIDSFCNMLSKEHPVELGIPASSEVIDDEQFSKRLKQFYSRLLGGVYGNVLQKEALDYQNTISKPEDTFLLSIKAMLERRDSNIVIEKINESLDDYIKDEKEKVLNIIDFVLSREFLFKGETDKTKKAFSFIKNNAYFLRKSWKKEAYVIGKLASNLCNIRFSEDVLSSRKIDTDLLIECGIRDKYYSFDSTKLDFIFKKYQNYCFNYSFNFFNKLLPIIEKENKEAGTLTYFDFLYHLKNTIQEDIKNGGKLSKHIFERHSYFLIDESQDTNPLQTELVFFLTSENPNPKWEECKPRKGSLFIVGDPKQSIYRFRGADVEAFSKTKELFASKTFGDVLYLTRNYRSNYLLRKYFNEVMPTLLNTDVEKCEHKEIPLDIDSNRIKEEDKSLYPLYCYSIEDNNQKASKDDADSVSKIIKQLVNNPEYLVIGKKDKIARKIKYSDIMVITFTTNFKKHIQSFIDNKIPFISEGKTLFNNSMILETLKDMLKAFSCPYNKNYVINLLLSKYCGLDINDMVLLKEKGFNFNLNNLVETGNLKVDEVLSNINRLYLKTKGLSYSGVFQYLLDDERFFEVYGTNYFECVYYALEIVRNYEANGQLSSPTDLAKLLDLIDSKNKDFERSINFTNNPNCIKIANVHKVKGLQAPIVILSQPRRTMRDPVIYASRNKENVDTYFLKIADTNNEIEEKLLINHPDDKIFEKAFLANEAEKARIEYVAATRAEACLIVSMAVSKEGTVENNSWQGIIDVSRDYMKPFEFNVNTTLIKEETIDIETKLNESLEAKDKLVSKLDNLSRSTYKVVKPSLLKETDVDKKIYKVRIVEDYDENDEITNKGTDEFDATLKGTMVHRLLECLVNSKGKLDLNQLSYNVAIEYDAISYKDKLLEIANIFTHGGFKQLNGLDIDLYATLLKADQVICEIPFAYKDNENIVNGSIDLAYLIDGKWHIIDYKTNKEHDVSLLEAEYKGQLDSYKEVFKKLTNEDADSHIYHIDI